MTPRSTDANTTASLFSMVVTVASVNKVTSSPWTASTASTRVCVTLELTDATKSVNSMVTVMSVPVGAVIS